MKALIINQYGSPKVLQYADVEKPQSKPDQLLVKVCASSVNPINWKIRKGMLALDKLPLAIAAVATSLLEISLHSKIDLIHTLFSNAKVGEAIGKVTDINWRAVRLETIDNYQINGSISN